MKTWEMIKELTKNPKKKFIRKGDPLEITADGLKYLRWASGHDYINLDHDWEEVRKPVPFIEVVKAAKEGNRVGLNFNRFGINYTKWELRDLMIDLGQDFEDEELAEIILNGKWYIED